MGLNELVELLEWKHQYSKQLQASICSLIFIELMIAIFTNSIYNNFYLHSLKSCGKFHLGHYYIIEANGTGTNLANKMNMIIMMMAFAAIIFTQSITNRIIRSWNSMNDSFFNK